MILWSLKITIMKKFLTISLSLITWFAIITQYILMIQNRVTSITESTIRFFSFFTILTNLLVAIYFTCLIFKQKWISKQGTLTAITVYITIVGLVYQIALRHIWEPKGMQLIVDELLHSVIPILVIIFWYFYQKTPNNYSKIKIWTLYPLIYLFYVLIRGSFSDFYPYPFIDVTHIGWSITFTNAAVLLLVFILFSSLFIFIENRRLKIMVANKSQ